MSRGHAGLQRTGSTRQSRRRVGGAVMVLVALRQRCGQDDHAGRVSVVVDLLVSRAWQQEIRPLISKETCRAMASISRGLRRLAGLVSLLDAIRARRRACPPSCQGFHSQEMRPWDRRRPQGLLTRWPGYRPGSCSPGPPGAHRLSSPAPAASGREALSRSCPVAATKKMLRPASSVRR